MGSDYNDEEVFVWKKKLQQEGKGKLSNKEIAKLNREKVAKNLEEIETLKRNRDARQAAREDMEMIARDEERSRHSEWRRVEDSFHLKQALLRSKLRLKERRAKTIDLLGRYICFGDPIPSQSQSSIDKCQEYEDFELVMPTVYLKDLSQDDLEDLLEDIRIFRLIDKGLHSAFWDDIVTLVKADIKKYRQTQGDDDIPSSVVPGVLSLFEGKNFEQLKKLQDDMVEKLRGDTRSMNTAFYETALDLLRPKIAKTRLKEAHSEKLKLRLQRIRESQQKATEEHERARQQELAASSHHIKIALPDNVEDEKESKPSSLTLALASKRDDQAALDAYDAAKPLPFTVDELAALDDEHRESKWQALNGGQLERFTITMYRDGAYSPTLVLEDQAMPSIEIIDANEEAERVAKLRSGEDEPKDSATEQQMMEIAKRGMSGEECSFAVEADIGNQEVQWAAKYRPQKPKYFNRVHTGFDWNKYNQTHYDMDNPPPKIVQGYRFNIFYPDLMDTTKTPGFKLFEDPSDPDFATLRFHAGPPYEDIAFKIVNREWEANHKNGYKVQFANGVFQLWFLFKRYRYRR